MIELIPAIDLINGQCVRLTKGDYDQKKVYNDNPAEIAKQFEQMGFKTPSCSRPRWSQVKAHRK